MMMVDKWNIVMICCTGIVRVTLISDIKDD